MSPARMNKIESAMRVALAFTEAFNRQDLPAMLQLVGENCRYESPAPPPEGNVYAGKDQIAQYWREFFMQYPHVHMKTEDLFGFGARCVLYWKCEWLDAHGSTACLRGVDIYEVQDEVIQKRFTYVKGRIGQA